jgi:hypothetical protein
MSRWRMTEQTARQYKDRREGRRHARGAPAKSGHQSPGTAEDPVAQVRARYPCGAKIRRSKASSPSAPTRLTGPHLGLAEDQDRGGRGDDAERAKWNEE